MKNIKVLCLLAFSLLFIQACDDDQELALDEEGLDENTENPTEETEVNLIHTWTNLLLELERYSGGRPNASARALAYIYLASYETAVPGMSNYISLEDELRGLRIRNDQRADQINYELAINAAMEVVVDHFLLDLPSEESQKIGLLADEIEAEMALELDEDILADSKEWGTYIANRVIDYAESDREAERQILDPQPVSYEPPVGEGYWTYSADPERALYPYWASTRTFVISTEETSSIPPIAYSEDPESDYFAEMLEIYVENNAARAEDGEQLWIAEFWSDDVEGLMMSPPARQVSIANQLVAQYELSLDESLALYVKLGFALNDAAVAAWTYKYEYMVMRPNVFIHEFIDADFQTNLYRLVFWPNPSFPSYPSGHSTFASAAGGVFIDAFGSSTNFIDRTHEGRTEFRGAPRSFSSFEELAEENAFSRIPLGVHMRMDCVEGLRLGYEISDAINQLDLRSEEGV